jgi:hypothetical protein
VQALDAICNLHIEVELVTCMMLISTLGRNNAWVLAEATFMAFFRQSGHFNELEAMPKAATTHSAMQSVLRLSSQLPMGMDAYARSGMLLGHILEFVDVYKYAKYHRSARRLGNTKLELLIVCIPLQVCTAQRSAFFVIVVKQCKSRGVF